MPWLESLAYGLSRGFWRAYLDMLREPTTAEEEPDAEIDRLRADRLRAAVQQLRTDQGNSDSLQENTPSYYEHG